MLPFFAGLTKLSNSSVCSILMKVVKKPLDTKSVMVRMTENPDYESSDSRKPLLALMNCIYESQNKDIYKFVKFVDEPETFPVSFTGLGLDPMDCMSLGYFFASKQLDKLFSVELVRCCIGDIGIEVFMKELTRGCMPKGGNGIILSLTGSECSHHGVKCICETMCQTLILQGLAFVDWILYQRKVDAAESLTIDIISALTYLIEGLCKRSARYRCISLQQFALHKCVNCKHTYHIILLIAFGNLQHLDLNNNDIGRSSVMSLLAQSLRHSNTLVGLQMDECNINDSGLQHLGSGLQHNKTITFLSIANNSFSSEALSSFLKMLCTAKLQCLQLESLTPQHNTIVKRINAHRFQFYLPPLELWRFKSLPNELCKSFYSLPNSLSMRTH